MVRFIRIRYLYIIRCDSEEFSKDTELMLCVIARFIVVYVSQGSLSQVSSEWLFALHATWCIEYVR